MTGMVEEKSSNSLSIVVILRLILNAKTIILPCAALRAIILTFNAKNKDFIMHYQQAQTVLSLRKNIASICIKQFL